ncbi:NADPH:quinone reductase [Actinoplanes cyaneus]|uniref:NADPH:quinone reductase n=1 Tax=Actinoplanes cyaneus TaxID=52696 RepID=A0A919ISM2_9ACTN|nr:NADPH:quinone reductase [Actinoplanes cyaneus]
MIQDDDVPLPVPAVGEVLVEVAATSFNPSDLGVRRGLFPIDLPFTLCGDVAGTVGGTPVIGRVVAAGADFVTVPASDLVPAPATIPLAHAAAIPIAGLTAWQAVFDHARITAGMRVLINGAGGGVGGFAVQLAKHAGAHVTATASPRSAAAVRAHGADEIVDYTTAPLPAGTFEAVLNLVHVEPSGAEALVALGGTLVSVTVPIGIHFVARNDVRQLSGLVALIDAGVVKVDIAAVRSLTGLADVHRDAEAGLLRGKTILTT